jgi:putative transposase
MTRQNFYKQKKVRQKQVVNESLILASVRQERSLQPRLGTRKMLDLIRPDLQSARVSIGRDRFFTLLSANNLLIERKKRNCRTTNSRHGFDVYRNIRKNCVTTGPHQVLVSDITYLRTGQTFVYLALVMDAHSRAIVGFDCSDSLEALGALRALSMAVKQLPAKSGAIHHSDCGTQYCCKAYIKKLKTARLRISMTEENHCYENSQAERLNGILKQEYGLGDIFAHKADAYDAVRQAVWLYNHRRPHGKLANNFPMTVHAAD